MKIKKLKVNKFGKLNDFEVKLNDGLNIIYGSNEAGKTTLQTFLKSMFYGMSANRSKSIRNRDRIRFKPWQGGKPSGEVHIEVDNGDNIIINREFGDSAATDTTLIISELTGKNTDYIDSKEPGYSLFDLKEEGFERTLLINQLSLKIDSGNDGEIEKKLSNLQQSGDEGISYREAKDNLKKMLKLMTNNGKNPINLPLLEKEQSRLTNLIEEKSILIKKHQENLEDEAILKELNDEKIYLEKLLEETKQKIVDLKLYQLHLEYEDLLKYQAEIDQDKEIIKELDKILIYNNFMVDEDYITKLNEDYKDYLQEIKVLGDLEIERDNIKESIKEIEDELSYFSGFETYDDNIDIVLAEKEERLEHLSEKQLYLENLKDQINTLESDITDKTNKLGDLIKFETAIDSLDIELNSKFNSLNNYKKQLSDTTKIDTLEYKKGIKLFDLQKCKISIIISFITCILVVAATILFYPVFIIGLFGPIPFMIYHFHKLGKVNSALMLIDIELEEEKNKKVIKSEIARLENELNSIYQKYGISNIDEYFQKKNKYNIKIGEINTIKASLNSKKNELFNYNEDEINQETKAISAFITEVLCNTNCDNIKNFILKYQRYSILKINKNNIDDNLLKAETKINNQNILINNYESNILNFLAIINLVDITSNELKETIMMITESYKQKTTLVNRITLNQSLYNSILKNRNLADILVKIKEFKTDEFNINNSLDEETLELTKINLLSEITETDKRIKETELNIEKRFFNLRSLDIVEEEISACKLDIEVLEKEIETIEMTLSVLEDSFNELQKSFGPRLKKSVENILEELTDGKYNEIYITEDFEIKIKESTTGKYFDIDYLSNGTLDQIYFSLRLALVELFYENKKIPLFMDDSFVQYDDDRVKWALDYLVNKRKNMQVILFTCQKRELDYLKNNQDVNIIDLDKLSA